MVFHCMMSHSLCIHSLFEGHLGYFHFGAIVTKADITFTSMFLCECKFLVYLGTYLGVRSLGHMVSAYLTLWEIARLFSRVNVPLSIPTSNEWAFLLLGILQDHLVLSGLFILAILINVYGYLIVLLICVSLMTNDFEHLFICLFSIHISSLVNCLFTFFVQFLLGCFFS